jgi:hypothetical protein
MSDPMKGIIANILGKIGAEMDGPYGDDAVPVINAADLVRAEDDLDALITKAREEEREACAQCADRVALPRDKKNMLTGTDINAGMTIAASVIAQAIRSRGES